MIEGKLKNGFEYSIDDDARDDWELLTAIREVDKGDTSAIVDVAEMLLGKEQLDKLVAHLKKDGRAKVTDMVEAIYEILESNGEVKNS